MRLPMETRESIRRSNDRPRQSDRHDRAVRARPARLGLRSLVHPGALNDGKHFASADNVPSNMDNVEACGPFENRWVDDGTLLLNKADRSLGRRRHDQEFLQRVN